MSCRLLAAVFCFALAGCPSQSTPVVSQPLPKPPIEVSYDARQVLKQLAREQKFGDNWWLRLHMVWQPVPHVVIEMVHEPPADTDTEFNAEGIRCVWPRELSTYLNKARVEWVEEEPKGHFDLSFENQSPAERDARRQWLREEEERRKGMGK